MEIDRKAVLERMRICFELSEAAEAMVRLRLQREHGDDVELIERRLLEWRLSRPNAPDGDAVGRPVRRFE